MSRCRLRGLRVAQRAGRREHLAGFQQRLQAGEDHGPAAVELAVRLFAQLVWDFEKDYRTIHGLAERIFAELGVKLGEDGLVELPNA